MDIEKIELSLCEPCEACNGRRGVWDPVVQDQWYSCEYCVGSGADKDVVRCTYTEPDWNFPCGILLSFCERERGLCVQCSCAMTNEEQAKWKALKK